jgi:hypothetical protein
MGLHEEGEGKSNPGRGADLNRFPYLMILTLKAGDVWRTWAGETWIYQGANWCGLDREGYVLMKTRSALPFLFLFSNSFLFGYFISFLLCSV